VTGGGGGWAIRSTASPSACSRTCAAAAVSLEGARDDYGVVIDPATMALDDAATAARRRDHRPEAKLFHRRDYVEAMV